jgi:hypothetical protein
MDEYTTERLLKICAVDNGWAADELEVRINNLRNLLLRCSTLCNHLAAERPPGISRFVAGRWLISDEPLRNDARALLHDIGKAILPE